MTEEQEAAAKSGKLPPRLHAHADMDVLTILYQREGAFQSLPTVKTGHVLRSTHALLWGKGITTLITRFQSLRTRSFKQHLNYSSPVFSILALSSPDVCMHDGIKVMTHMVIPVEGCPTTFTG